MKELSGYCACKLLYMRHKLQTCASKGPARGWYKKTPETFNNTCAIRLSYALNEAGFTIPETNGTYKGADGKNYFIKVSTITIYLSKTYGEPTTLNAGETLNYGIIWQSNCGWRDATGHVDIIYGAYVGSQFYNNCGVTKYW